MKYEYEEFYLNTDTQKMEEYGNDISFSQYEDALNHSERNINVKEYEDGIYENRIYQWTDGHRECIYKRKFRIARIVEELGSD